MVAQGKNRRLKWHELPRHLAGNPPGGCYAFCGPELFLKSEALVQIKGALLGQAGTTQARYAVDTFIAGETPVQEIATVACQAGLFGSEKLLLVESFERLSRAGKREKDAWIDLAGRSAANPIVFLSVKTSKELSQKAKFFANLLKPVLVVDFWHLFPRDAQRWVTQRAAQLDLRLSPNVAAYLVERIGTDLQLLAQEVEKISLMHGKGDLDLRALRDLVRSGMLGSSWQCVEAILGGNLREAMDRFQSVQREESSFSFLWKLAYSTANAIDQGFSSQSGRGGYDRWGSQSRSPLGPAEKQRLAKLLSGCYDWERTLKSGGWVSAHDFVALERLILEHVSERPGKKARLTEF